MPIFNSASEFYRKFSTALLEDRIVPFYQPIFSVEKKKILGFEILARWITAEGEIISPYFFIKHAEQAGMLTKMFLHLLDKTLQFSKELPCDLFFSLNLSPTQMNENDLPRLIQNLALKYDVELSRIHLEITETAILEDNKDIHTIFNQLINMGCHVSFDDFGTGYSSLKWLIDYPFSAIKIDLVFVQNLLTQKESRKVISAIIVLCHSLNMSVIAEGVENIDQIEILTELGCNTMQGYFFSPPVPQHEVTPLFTLLAHKTCLRKSFRKKLSLEQAAHQMQALYASNNLLLIFIDTHYTILDISNGFLNISSKPTDDILFKNLFDVLPHMKEKFLQLQAYRDLGNYPVFELNLMSGACCLCSIHQIKDEIGELLGFSIVAIDITERKQLEYALKESKEQLLITSQLSPRVSWHADTTGQIIYIDEQRSQMLFDTTFDEIKNHNWLNHIHPDEVAKIKELYQFSIETGEIFNTYFHVFYKPQNKYRRFHAYMAPLRDETGKIVKWFGQAEFA